MSITVDDLKEPEGELDLGLLFPDKTATQAEDDLQTWIDLGVTQATQAGLIDPDNLDRGVKAFAYYRAYKSIYQRLSASPISANIQDAGISSSMSQGQINSFLQKYLDWERIWIQMLGTINTTAFIPPVTLPVDTEISW